MTKYENNAFFTEQELLLLTSEEESLDESQHQWIEYRSRNSRKIKEMTIIESRLPFRVLHESWWPQELPSQEEMEEGLRNLANVDFKVDYVITHCCATNLQKVIDPIPEGSYQPDVLTDYLQQIEDKLTYRQWYFGHYHDDWQVDEKHMMLYHGILLLGGSEDDLHMLPVLGWPRYQIGDKVMFQIDEIQKVGKIFVVDDYGASLLDEEPSYDILVEEENCICKHIVESMVIGKMKEQCFDYLD